MSALVSLNTIMEFQSILFNIVRIIIPSTTLYQLIKPRYLWYIYYDKRDLILEFLGLEINPRFQD